MLKKKRRSILQSGRKISRQELDKIQETVGVFPRLSRTELAAMNLAWVINNSRSLIFPWVQVKNLASHVLGMVARRVKEDWQERWGYSPVLAETFVDPQYYEGICYKAANWQYLGMTTGEGLVRKGRTYTTISKKIFVKPLVKDWQSLLCSEQLKGRVDE